MELRTHDRNHLTLLLGVIRFSHEILTIDSSHRLCSAFIDSLYDDSQFRDGGH